MDMEQMVEQIMDLAFDLRTEANRDGLDSAYANAVPERLRLMRAVGHLVDAANELKAIG